MIPPIRPSPDDLLKLATVEERRGKLKVFLGAAAGVGKTYAMLSAAHELREKGTDVAIGFIETHDRLETSKLVSGIEVIPLLAIKHRDIEVKELNVLAILQRSPQLVLIDELPHTNTPGSRHSKRYQDIDEILQAGIDVYTAMNIQHLESLKDVVKQITGVEVKETVPDSFVWRANEIELIDLPVTELQQRIKEGKVYASDKIQSALESFFTSSNLIALRELALRGTANAVDSQLEMLRLEEGIDRSCPAKDRIVVCVAPNQMGAMVVRSAARLGDSSHASIIAVYVESSRQIARPAEAHQAVEDALDLARQLGMEVVRLSGYDIVNEVLTFARRKNANLIVVGKPIRPRWKELLFGSVVDELVRASGTIDVHVITAQQKGQSPRPNIPVRDEFHTRGLLIVALNAAVCTGLGLALFQAFGVVNVALIYILGVAICSTLSSRTESAVSAVLAVVCYNYFFVPPRFSFAVHDIRNLFVFGILLIVGLVISTLTHRLREELKGTSERERSTASLYALSRYLNQERGKNGMAAFAAKEIRGIFDGDVAVFGYEEGKLEPLENSESGFEANSNEIAVATWVAEHGTPAGIGTETLPGARALYLPIQGAEATVGVLAFQSHSETTSGKQRQLLEAFTNGLGAALERAILVKQSQVARIEIESVILRNTLLSSISHDLRTPLTAITGAASSLISSSNGPTELAQTIYDESIRLNRQIQNLLDMTRLQASGIALDFQWHSPEELGMSAIQNSVIGLSGIQIKFLPKSNLPLLSADGVLVEKALINLLENAGRYTPEGKEVLLSLDRINDQLVFTVVDSGPGIDPAVLPNLFKAGFSSPGGGFGLGLGLVKAVMDLHGGTVAAENLPQGGAKFTLTFPTVQQPEILGADEE